MLWELQGRRKPCSWEGSRKLGGTWPTNGIQESIVLIRRPTFHGKIAKINGSRFCVGSEALCKQQSLGFLSGSNNNIERYSIKINRLTYVKFIAWFLTNHQFNQISVISPLYLFYFSFLNLFFLSL